MSLLFIAIRLPGRRGTRKSRKRRRRGLAEPDVGLVPQPWTEAPHLKLASIVALSAWVLLPTLTTIQLVLSAQSASADAESSRSATAAPAAADGADPGVARMMTSSPADWAALIGVVAVVVACREVTFAPDPAQRHTGWRMPLGSLARAARFRSGEQGDLGQSIPRKRNRLTSAGRQ